MSIIRENREYINRMSNPEYEDALIRIGNIWYGVDSLTTVSGIYYFTNKKITPVKGLRVEAALSMASSQSPIDSVQIELIINYLRFTSHLQKLFALTQCCPIIPILNPLVASLLQPMSQNKSIYASYGIKPELLEYDSQRQHPLETKASATTPLLAYASTPVMIKIDNIHTETIENHPREIRIILKVTRVLTSTAYGDKTLYITDLEGAVKQSKVLDDVRLSEGDTPQIDAMARMFGVNVPQIRDMIKYMNEESPYTEVKDRDLILKRLVEVTSGDTLEFIPDLGKGKKDITYSCSIFGIDAPINREHIGEYNLLNSYNEQVPGNNLSKLALTNILNEAIKNKSIITMIDEGQEYNKLAKKPGRVTKRYQIIIKDANETKTDVGRKMIQSGYVYPSKELVEYPAHPLYKEYMDAWGGELIKQDTIKNRERALPGYCKAMISYNSIYVSNITKLNDDRYLPYRKSTDIYQTMIPDEYRTLLKRSSIGVKQPVVGPFKEVNLIVVLDGDTIIVNDNGEFVTVRFLEIDTPESSDNRKGRADATNLKVPITTIIEWGKMATNYVKGRIKPGDKLTLRFGQKVRDDKYGRTLAYVYLQDNEHLNKTIIAEGYAAPLRIAPNTRFNAEFYNLYKEAAKANKGIWEYWTYNRP